VTRTGAKSKTPWRPLFVTLQLYSRTVPPPRTSTASLAEPVMRASTVTVAPSSAVAQSAGQSGERRSPRSPCDAPRHSFPPTAT
jgi:hypothetical protein